MAFITNCYFANPFCGVSLAIPWKHKQKMKRRKKHPTSSFDANFYLSPTIPILKTGSRATLYGALTVRAVLQEVISNSHASCKLGHRGNAGFLGQQVLGCPTPVTCTSITHCHWCVEIGKKDVSFQLFLN